MKKDYNPVHPYQKLGGWLLLIVIVTFIGALSTAINLLSKDGLRSLQNFEGGRLWLELLIQLCWIYAGALQVTYAVMIIKRDPRFGRTWQLIYIGTFLRALARLVMGLSYGFPTPALAASGSPEYVYAFGLTNAIVAFLPPIVNLLLLTLYLKKSVRVRTYMGSGKYLQLAFFPRNAEAPVPMVPDAPAEQEED